MTYDFRFICKITDDEGIELGKSFTYTRKAEALRHFPECTGRCLE